MLFAAADGAFIAHVFKRQFALRATRIHLGIEGLTVSENFDAFGKNLLQTHGRDIVREREAPTRQTLGGVDQTQGAHTGMVVVFKGHASLQVPRRPLHL